MEAADYQVQNPLKISWQTDKKIPLERKDCLRVGLDAETSTSTTARRVSIAIRRGVGGAL